ncbi:MAG: hypothetical protein V7740_10560 [Pseudomonas marincola]
MGRTRTEKASIFLTVGIGVVIILMALPIFEKTPVKAAQVLTEALPEFPQNLKLVATVVLPPPPPMPLPTLKPTPVPPPITPKLRRPSKPAPPKITAPVKTISAMKAPAQIPKTVTSPTKEPPPETSKPDKASVKIETIKEDAVSEGRVLLKLLETGKGPDVEIAWPARSDQRQKLFNAFQTCLGTQTGLMMSSGSIYVAGGDRRQPMVINRDRTSLFLRQSAGVLPTDEARQHTAIRSYHGIKGGAPVRVFQRVIDAALLGGLFRLVSADVTDNIRVRGQYGLKAGAITIENISVNGAKRSGHVEIRTSLLGICR